MPTHTRIRMFNTKETYPNQALNNDLCQAVRAGNTVYVRGQVGTDFAGNLIGLGDPRAQAEQAMKNVEQLLKEAGSDLSHIVKTTTYLIDPRYREPVYQEVGKWLKGVFPISTGVVVSALAQPQWLMEIDVTAVIPDDWQGGAAELPSPLPPAARKRVSWASPLVHRAWPSGRAVHGCCPAWGRFPARILPCRRWGRRSSARSRRGPALSRP